MERSSSQDRDVAPGKSCFKDENAFFLRPQMEPQEGFSYLGLLVLVACLIMLFLLIWFVVNRILLLEIESQVSDQALRNQEGRAVFN